jgi:predicted aspartyl protease
MNGYVDAEGRSLLSVSVCGIAGGPSQEINVWIDTGFNGDLVLPRRKWVES